ncbi:rod shape-determining protein MreC [Elizabethkingia argentiflava]|uniref:Cell shape-determining protein MreC n=1 Tax=Elizabethkingia argenteiflava TaxID=2681556 RepID=A0A845PWH5_9FLAO|nr:rod shape-determining protein MreC [Elizabethkingia argenteiflava]NAW51533.1 rod shape-determining protein MreC [Elizabethkingia argenteiflava]
MSFLVRLFSRYGFFVFFVFLQIIAVCLIFRKNAMQQSFIAAQTSAFNSRISGYIDEGTNYLKLKQINEDLVAQNKALMIELYGKNSTDPPKYTKVNDSIKGEQVYSFVDADVIFNSINRNDNYFTINRGSKHGISPEMGVISPRGIAGIIINTTSNYALAQSILSVHKIRINAALKNSGYFGTLTWRGEDTRTMHLSDVPRYVPLKIGDTVVTDDKSSIFPKGIMVGKIAGYDVDPKTGFWDISVELSEKLGQTQKVFVVNNLKKTALKQIQDTLTKVQNDK